MQMFLLQIAQRVMGLVSGISMLGDGDYAAGKDGMSDFYKSVFEPVVQILDAMLVPILILIGTAGSIYAIILGVNFSKAESSDKREEAKKRIINVLGGMVIIVGLILLLQLFMNQILPNWL